MFDGARNVDEQLSVCETTKNFLEPASMMAKLDQKLLRFDGDLNVDEQLSVTDITNSGPAGCIVQAVE